MYIKLLTLFSLTAFVAHADPAQDAIKQLQGFNLMRESLAGSIDPKKEPITPDTFKKTCMPVGLALKDWGKQKGYKVRQVSHKYRNPDHAPTADEQIALDRFLADKKLEHWQDDQSIYVRIPMAQSCLHCHGEKSSRPDFIKKKYPKDRAFDFKPGELRGLYRVDLPR